MFPRDFELRHRVSLALAVAIVPVALACAGGGDAADTTPAAPVCTVRSDSIVGGAVEKFIVTRNPVPHRFLIPLGTDSVVPETSRYPFTAGGRALFTWPQDAEQQKEMIGIMRSSGGWVTLATFYHGTTELSDGRTAVTLSGLYIDAANNNKRVPRTTVTHHCFGDMAGQFIVDTAAAPSGG